MKKSRIFMSTIAILLIITCGLCFAGCEMETSGTDADISTQKEVAANLAEHQATPTDVDYSLERYNLIRRTYWVNGQREKANSLVCEITKPLGYIVLIGDNGVIIGSFVVDGKVSSLNSFLTPNYDEEYYANGAVINTELADIDGSYGENDSGIFFFTPDGKYIEWTGNYLYSDIPFEVENPVVKIKVGE